LAAASNSYNIQLSFLFPNQQRQLRLQLEEASIHNSDITHAGNFLPLAVKNCTHAKIGSLSAVHDAGKTPRH